MIGAAMVLALTVSGLQASDGGGFGGAPPLGPADSLRHLLRPYDLVKLNVLGANYCENLLDMRVNTTSYTHMGYDSPTSDAWHLQFPDDAARFLEAVVWEDQYSPVVRLELARRLVKGMLAGRIPGTYSESYFRHRSGGKTFLIFGDQKSGRMLLSNWGDEISGALKVGFRVQSGGQWHETAEFHHTDPPGSVTEPGEARSPLHWNESPVTVHRHYEGESGPVDFTGRYWMSDEDRPLEFSFAAPKAHNTQVVVGEPGAPLPLLGDYRIPTTIHLPDRKTTYRSDVDGDRSFDHPGFRYLIVRKPGAWGATGYSAALLVMWEGQPERVEVVADKGYGEVRVTYAGASGKVWLYPYYWLDDVDLDSVHRSAEQFLSTGTLLQNGFPSQQLVNAIPAGLAAGAYLLTKYRDPLALTARINAARAVDRLFAAEDEDKKLIRVFFTVKAAGWMVKTAKELGDSAMEARYTALLDRAMKRMCSPETGYDGKGWAGGWDHFCSARALWLAYDATGNPAYKEAFDRALSVYTIDPKGIYRYGKRMDAPGGFDTYSGSLALALWGNAGKLDWADMLINLDVPNGWYEPSRPVKDTWNDAGAGPWAQDDANPEYVGFCLRGANLPQPVKYVLPVGAFPSYDKTGAVTITGKPLVRNPFFLPGVEPVHTIPAGRKQNPAKTTSTNITPGTDSERQHGIRLSGNVSEGRRTCAGGDEPLVYRFDTKGAAGMALDLRIMGDGYRVEVSPDGKRWFTRLDTWDRVFADQSLDLSFLAGSREELVKLFTIAPPDDKEYLLSESGSTVERGNCRYVAPGGALVYRIDVSQVAGCWLEMLLGNGYKVEISSDGKTWHRGIAASDSDGPALIQATGRAVSAQRPTPNASSANPSIKAGPDGTVIRMLDISPCLGHGRYAYVRLSGGDSAPFAGRNPFIRRITAYGTVRTDHVWVRISNVAARPDHTFTLARLTLRRWR